LQQHGGKKQKTSSSTPSTPSGTDGSATISPFQQIFKYRAQGFEISFKFRNAPPRPPVGPNFMGADLDEKLRDLSKYKPLNAIDENYRWKLHTEPDLGVPLAPSAIDPHSYQFDETNAPPLDAADLDLLEWKGSMGDTAAEELKKIRDNARAAARLALLGKGSLKDLMSPKSKTSAAISAESESTRKIFSRVLNEGMQSWMKKTTYMTNDYSRRVHDFKSLAKTKREAEDELDVRQQTITQRRSTAAISKTFDEVKQTVTLHPSKSNVHPVAEMEFLPDATHWGHSYTHVVVDKAPDEEDVSKMAEAIVGNVLQDEATARMKCDFFVPSKKDIMEDSGEETPYEAAQQYDLEVVPLKEEDAPHITFCIWVNQDSGLALYTPVSSRVHLSSGKSLKNEDRYQMQVARRQMDDDDKVERQERLMELESDAPLKGDDGKDPTNKTAPPNFEEDDEDSDREASFMNTRKSIVADG
jgi:Paf1